MTAPATDNSYFRGLAERFGAGWNRFWFAPGDPFPLCALRILAGLMALYLHASYTPDLLRLFGENGLLPVGTVRQLQGGAFGWSYLDYVHGTTPLRIAHALGFVVLASFTVGLFARASAVAALVVVLSYIHRGPPLTHLVEPILAFVMFYLCLGPCGRYLSVDRWLAQRKKALQSIPIPHGSQSRGAQRSVSATVALRLLQVHLAVVYAMMALGKLSGSSPDVGSVWWTGEALWWLMAKPESRLLDLTWLSEHPYVINVWTHAVVWTELAFALLIFNRWARPLLLVLSTLVWLSLAVVTGFVPFCLLMIFANVAFVPPENLRRWLGRGQAADRAAG